MERQEFEEGFKDAFSNAELDPSPQVWDSIELGIMKAESEKMKSRMLFYKMLAAASVVFGLSMAGTAVYLFNPSNTVDEIAVNRSSSSLESAEKNNVRVDNSSKESNSGSADSKGVSDKTIPSSSVDDHAGDIGGNENVDRSNLVASVNRPRPKSAVLNKNKSQRGGVQINTNSNGGISTGDNAFPISANDDLAAGDKLASRVENDTQQSMLLNTWTPRIAYIPEVKVHLPEQQKPDDVALMLARLNDFEKAEQEKEKKEKKGNSNEKIWTSVGFAAGAFSGGNASVSTKSTTTMNTFVADKNNDIADKEANAPGISYSVGVNLGAKVANRWVVQGGFNYMTQSSDYTVDNAISSSDLKSFAPASINGIRNESGDAKVVTTAPYNVNNNVQYLSVPMQAGYLLLNKKFGIQLNAGVSTDLFLKNEKSADADNFKKIDEGRNDSPYRPVNFSGLMGAEFSYKLGQRYRVALNPGMRYPFNSIYKSDVGVKALPFSYDVGLRFRYIFH